MQNSVDYLALAFAAAGGARNRLDYVDGKSLKWQPLRPVKIESNDGTTTRRHFSGWVQSIHPAANKKLKYRKTSVKIGKLSPILSQRL